MNINFSKTKELIWAQCQETLLHLYLLMEMRSSECKFLNCWVFLLITNLTGNLTLKLFVVKLHLGCIFWGYWNVAEYHSLILCVLLSVLEYACPAWHNSLTAEQIGNIESVQKRAINIIYGYVDYYEKLAELDLPTLYCHRESICKSFLNQY